MVALRKGEGGVAISAMAGSELEMKTTGMKLLQVEELEPEGEQRPES